MVGDTCAQELVVGRYMKNGQRGSDNDSEEDKENEKKKQQKATRAKKEHREIRMGRNSDRTVQERRRDFDRTTKPRSVAQKGKRGGPCRAFQGRRERKERGRGRMKSRLRLWRAYERPGKSGLSRTCWPPKAAKCAVSLEFGGPAGCWRGGFLLQKLEAAMNRPTTARKPQRHRTARWAVEGYQYGPIPIVQRPNDEKARERAAQGRAGCTVRMTVEDRSWYAATGVRWSVLTAAYGVIRAWDKYQSTCGADADCRMGHVPEPVWRRQ